MKKATPSQRWLLEEQAGVKDDHVDDREAIEPRLLGSAMVSWT
jgi:hypothetical protein